MDTIITPASSETATIRTTILGSGHCSHILMSKQDDINTPSHGGLLNPRKRCHGHRLINGDRLINTNDQQLLTANNSDGLHVMHARYMRVGPSNAIKNSVNSDQMTISDTPLLSKDPSFEACKHGCAIILARRYIILDPCDGNCLHRCFDTKTKEDLICKTVNNPCTSLLAAHFRLDGHPHINSFKKVLQGTKTTHLLFTPPKGDLHSYVRIRKRLRESEARNLFKQMCETVRACHDKGIVLRDLKLRKFIFANSEKTHVLLESLEDAVVLDNPDHDELQDKRGCPAYVSPEILKANATYSGKAADMWSLGVILYTMLVGRYPFNDSVHGSLFVKISRGQFVLPDCLSSTAKCIIRSLLRREPEERITSDDVLYHPWLSIEDTIDGGASSDDQCVPEMYSEEEELQFKKIKLESNK